MMANETIFRNGANKQCVRETVRLPHLAGMFDGAIATAMSVPLPQPTAVLVKLHAIAKLLPQLIVGYDAAHHTTPTLCGHGAGRVNAAALFYYSQNVLKATG